MKTGIKISVVVGIVASAFLLAGIIYATKTTTDNFNKDFTADGFILAQGYSNSPTMVQYAHNYVEFVNIARQNNITTIFQVSNDPAYMFVVNATYGCKFRP